jgi:hypothetical protein
MAKSAVAFAFLEWYSLLALRVEDSQPSRHEPTITARNSHSAGCTLVLGIGDVLTRI